MGAEDLNKEAVSTKKVKILKAFKVHRLEELEKVKEELRKDKYELIEYFDKGPFSSYAEFGRFEAYSKSELASAYTQKAIFGFLALVIVGTWGYLMTQTTEEVGSNHVDKSVYYSKMAKSYEAKKLPERKQTFNDYAKVIKSRSDIPVLIEAMNMKSSTNIIADSLMSNNYITIQLSDDFKRVSPQQFKAGLVQMMDLWIEMYKHADNEQTEINAIYDGFMIGSITSDKDLRKKGIVIEGFWE